MVHRSGRKVLTLKIGRGFSMGTFRPLPGMVLAEGEAKAPLRVVRYQVK